MTESADVIDQESFALARALRSVDLEIGADGHMMVTLNPRDPVRRRNVKAVIAEVHKKNSIQEAVTFTVVRAITAAYLLRSVDLDAFKAVLTYTLEPTGAYALIEAAVAARDARENRA